MPSPETNLLDAQKEIEKPKLAKLIEISVDEKQMVYVNWPVDKKELTIVALCEALKLVAGYQSPIVQVHKPSIMDFIRGVKR